MTENVVANSNPVEAEQNPAIEIIDETGNKTELPPPPAPEREHWGSKSAYVLTLVGYAVGFGNVWRFPYQVRENGGLVYLIPYFAMMALIGIPIFFLELAVGQRRRKGIIYAWAEISPKLGGIGIACAWICFTIGLYYNTLIAYCISYLFDSFRSPLPWTSCAQISEYSGNPVHKLECEGPVGNRATKYYWFRRTLDVSPNYQTAGNFSWWLFLYIGLSWAIIYAILIKGTESVGATVYFTALFPYVILFIFFVGNFVVEREKAWLGAYRLAKPNWKFLWNPVTWLKAGSQIFYSLGLAEGCLVVFASYNPVRNNCYKDAVSISLINSFTSPFAALVVFPMLGLHGHRKYDECIRDMDKLFSSPIMKTNYEKKYDIYFFTKAAKWNEVDSAANNITVRYGYGELSDNEKASYLIKEHVSDEDVMFKELGKSDLVKTLQLSSALVADSLRDCSIGQEATASGEGTGLVFLAFTEAVLSLQGSNFWSVLFFFMLFTLGIDTGFGSAEGLIDALIELVSMKRFTATTISCGISALISLVLFSYGWGVYILDLMDQYTANWTLLVIACLECYAVAWDYGLAKISYDVLLMTGSKPNLFMLLCWKYFAPLIIGIILVGSIIEYVSSMIVDKGLKYTAFNPQHKENNAGDVRLEIPAYAISVGFLLMIFCIMWVPLQWVLRNTKYSMLKEQASAEFPEEELRDERNIHVEKEEEYFTDTEKAIIGGSLHSLQVYRDTLKFKRSAESLSTKNTSTSIPTLNH